MALIWRSEVRSPRRRRLTSVVVLVIAALLLVVAACGGDDDGAAPAAAPAVEPEAPAEEPAPAPEPAPAEELVSDPEPAPAEEPAEEPAVEPAEEAEPAGDPNPTTHVVQRIGTDTGELVATAELERAADDVAVVDDTVWLLDKSAGALHSVDPDGTSIAETVPVDVGVPSWRPERIAAGAGQLLVSGSTTSLTPEETTWSYDPESGSFSQVGGVTSGNSTVPSKHVFAAFGDIWETPIADPDVTSASQQLRVLSRYSGESATPVATNELIGTFPGAPEVVTTLAASLLFAEAGESLWVFTDAFSKEGLGQADSIVGWEVDPDTNSITGLYDVSVAYGGPVTAIATGPESLWIPDRVNDALVQFDPATREVVGEISVGSQPIGAVFANGAVWVAHAGDGTVSRIDPDTLDVTTTTVGGTPTGIVVTEDAVWVTVRP